MGMWDQVFMGNQRPSPNIGLALIPFIGPALAEALRRKQQASNEQQWTQENAAFYPDKDYSPDTMSGRIAQRMLQRTGGEMSIPGIMAATALQRQAQNPENMGNPGNIGMRAASDVMQANPAAGLKMAQMAHQGLQTPWKPSEGSAAVNVEFDPDTRLARDKRTGKYLPGQTSWKPYNRVIGEDQVEGYQQVTTDENGDVHFGDVVDKTKGTRYNSKTQVSVGGPTISSDSKADDILIGWEDQMDSAGETLSFIRNLRPNISTGTIGLPGAVTELVAKSANILDYVSKLTGSIDDTATVANFLNYGDNKSTLESIAARLPIKERALANYYIIGLAYSLARRHNFGSSDGGRNISNQDMEYALKRLQATTSPESLNAALDEEEKETYRHLNSQSEKTRRLLNGRKTQLDSFEQGYKAFGEKYKGFTQAVAPQGSSGVPMRSKDDVEYYIKNGKWPN